MVIFAVAILVLGLLYLLAIYGTFRMAFKPEQSDVDEYRKIPNNPQHQKYRKETWALSEKFASIPFETVKIESFDGYTLYARYYEVCPGAPIEIECHGYHGSPIRDFCGGNKIARESGINTLVIEQRGMHRSEARAITFGILERFDVKSWAEYCYKRFGEKTPIILAGVSMGAASVLMASELQLPPTVVGVIADCPYSSPLEIILEVANRKHMPRKIIRHLVKKAALLFGRFDIEDSTPLEAVRHTDLPILLIHGEADDFVPYAMSVEIARANPDIRFESFPEAGHGLSYMLDRNRYVRVVSEFTGQILEDYR